MAARALEGLYYFYPLVLLFYLVLAAGNDFRRIAREKNDTTQPFRNRRRFRTLTGYLPLLFAVSYSIEIIYLMATDLVSPARYSTGDALFCYAACAYLFAFSIGWRPTDRNTALKTLRWGWSLVLIFETAIMVAILSKMDDLPLRFGQLAFAVLRTGLVYTAAGLHLVRTFSQRSVPSAMDEERQPLLFPGTRRDRPVIDDSNPSSSHASEETEVRSEPGVPLHDASNRWTYIAHCSELLDVMFPPPALVPMNDRGIKLRGTQWYRIAESTCIILAAGIAGQVVDALLHTYFVRTWMYLSLFGIVNIVRYVLENSRRQKDSDAEWIRMLSMKEHLPVAAGIFDDRQYPDHHITASSAVAIFTNLAELYLEAAPLLFEMTLIPILLSVLFDPIQGLIVFVSVSTSLYLTAMGFFRAVKYQRAAKRDLLNFHDGRQARHFYANDWRSSLLDNLDMASMMIGFCGSTILAVMTIQALHAKLGSLMVLLLVWEYICASTRRTAGRCKKFTNDLTAAERLMMWRKDAKPVLNKQGAKPLRLTSGAITFDHVSLRGIGNKFLLQDINFEIPGGSIVAIVGKSGSGKTALLRLLARNEDATEGVISIDQQNISNVRLEGYRERIKLMPQEPVPIGETVVSTVKTCTSLAADADVEFACKVALIHREILRFPNGYHTRLGQGGFQVSRGQQQRLGIARIFLKYPDIFLMDNPTTSLSAEMESKVWGSLLREFGSRTVVVAT